MPMQQISSHAFSIDWSTRSLLVWGTVSLLVAAGIQLLWAVAPELYIWLGTEDALGENLTALFYFIAGVLLWIGVQREVRAGAPVRRFVLQVLLGLFFVFVAGEEISWGQRIIGFGTPDSMKDSNVQGEFNIHNYDFLSGDLLLDQHRLLVLFVLINGVILPICYRFIPAVRRFLNSIAFPMVPLCCAGFFILPLLQARMLSQSSPHWAHAEVSELVYASGFLLSSVAAARGTHRLP